jgi:hypothetical protein
MGSHIGILKTREKKVEGIFKGSVTTSKRKSWTGNE